MALTVTRSGDWFGRAGHKNEARVKVSFDTSYTTGGMSFKASDVGMRSIEFMSFSSAAGGYQFDYDYTNSKIQVFTQAVTTGATGTADATAGALAKDDTGAEGVVRFMGTATATTYHFGPLQEVPNAVDLSGITGLRVDAIGY
jgi:hypothetical protein